jgi:hypothetical protein
MRELKRVHSEPGAEPGARVSVEFEADARALTARFEVRSSIAPRTRPDLALGTSQWGLWEWDVVELFVRGQGAHYYEFQVSPLGQHFELKILEPRKRWDRDWTSGLRASATPEPWGWRGRLEIPLQALDGQDPEALEGGAFAILGAPGSKSYFGLYLPEQAKPDFHLPERFQPLQASRIRP